MVILGVTLVPFLHGARVFTAYEFLERRFDAKTRSLTAFLFLLSRGMSCGTILAAPAVVFSSIFGWPVGLVGRNHGNPNRDLHDRRRRTGGHVGRRQADGARRDRDRGRDRGGAVQVAREPRRRRSTSPALSGGCGCSTSRSTSRSTYTFWSGLIGGTFLMLSYFGTDQSQVQRFLTAKSVDEARSSLLISAYWKIPLQAGVLLVGVLVFVYLPVPAAADAVQPDTRPSRAGGAAGGSTRRWRRNTAPHSRNVTRPHVAIAAREDVGHARQRSASAEKRVEDVRTEALALAARVTGESSRDVNYIIPHFVLFDLARGSDGDLHRGGDGGRNVGGGRRAQLAGDGVGDRLLPPVVAA